jgi:muconolactone delta-isomerase
MDNSDKMKKYIVRQCKKQFLEKNKNKEKEITKDLTDEEIMMNVIRSGGSLYDFIDRLFDIEDIENETDDQFEYRRKMEDLFKQKKMEWKEKKI